MAPFHIFHKRNPSWSLNNSIANNFELNVNNSATQYSLPEVRELTYDELDSFKKTGACWLYVPRRPTSRIQTGDHERNKGETERGWRRGRSENRGSLLCWLASEQAFEHDRSKRSWIYASALAKFMYHALDEGKLLGPMFAERMCRAKIIFRFERSITKIIRPRKSLDDTRALANCETLRVEAFLFVPVAW